ncbi:seipin-like isoform X1 [Symsagittifera roscoffensis]|uniref:seipin-like isoform X1 n=1 Tax=Symsagittifera roscoffensis TaxID=84072 RepID=UPI00307C41DD
MTEEINERRESITHRSRSFPRISPSRVVYEARRNADELAVFVSDALRTLVVLLLIGWITLWISAFIYGSFYYNFLPKVSFKVEAHFNYDNCQGQIANSDGDRFCSFPTSNFSLLHNESLEEYLVQGQQYHLMLQLEMPESEVNRRVGVFMAVASIREKSREVFNIRRAAAMQYKSDLFYTMETVVLFPLYLLGSYRKQSQTVFVDLGLITSPSNDLNSASITLESRDVIVTSASFMGMAKFRGVRFWLYFYPVSVCVASISLLFSLLFPLLTISFFRFRHSTIMPSYLDFQAYDRLRLNISRRHQNRRNASADQVHEGIEDVEEDEDEELLVAEVETRGHLDSLDQEPIIISSSAPPEVQLRRRLDAREEDAENSILGGRVYLNRRSYGDGEGDANYLPTLADTASKID